MKKNKHLKVVDIIEGENLEKDMLEVYQEHLDINVAMIKCPPNYPLLLVQ